MVLLPAIEDRDIWAYFASLAFPREELVRQTLETLATEGKLATPALETRVELSRNRLETMLKVLDVDGAVRRVRGGWEATGEPWSYDAERYERVREAREREQRAMLDYLDTGGCRMRFLREQLDDPEAADCGRCDNCGGLSLDATVSKAAVEEAGTALSRPGVPIEPRKMWPTALATMGIDLKGKIQEPADRRRRVGRHPRGGHRLHRHRAWEPVHDAIRAGEVDVLLVSPERLNNPGFRDEVLPRLAATCGLLVVDEAHCISDWGHDFRPDYRRIRTLLADLPDGIPVLATTATANARVTDDVAEQLGTDVLVLRGASTASRCGSAWSGSRPPSSGWPGWPTTSPSSRASASSTA